MIYTEDDDWELECRLMPHKPLVINYFPPRNDAIWPADRFECEREPETCMFLKPQAA